MNSRKIDTSLGVSDPVAPSGLVKETLSVPSRPERPVGPGGPEPMDSTKVRPGQPPKKVVADGMLACRYEMKYLVTEIEAAEIARCVRPFLEYDKYSKLQRGGMYPIVSLYLDGPDLRLCRESLTGLKNRFKLRIRSYTDEPEYPRFAEIKRRINRVILKSRARVMDRDIALVLKGRRLPPQGYTTDETALSQFQLYVAAIHAGPAILIRYLRQAFESPSANRVRVTFDRNLCYKISDVPDVRLGGSGWQHNGLTLGQVILEIKFTGCYPQWLSRLVQDFNLEACSISKFATSMEQSCRLGFCGPAARSLWNG